MAATKCTFYDTMHVRIFLRTYIIKFWMTGTSGGGTPGLFWGVDRVEETDPRTCVDCPKHRQQILEEELFGYIVEDKTWTESIISGCT